MNKQIGASERFIKVARLRRSSVVFLTILGATWSSSSVAWFIWIPTGLISRALETDPASIQVSETDRSLGKCAGLHVNQAQKSAANSPYASEEYGLPKQEESPQTKFHQKMAELAVQKASEKEKVKELGEAYSTRWSRVAGADRSANLEFGRDLASNCAQNRIPATIAQREEWQKKELENRLEEQIQAAEREKVLKAEEEAKRLQTQQEQMLREREQQKAREATKLRPASLTTTTESPVTSNAKKDEIDFSAEAKKSARILGCITKDVRVTGADGTNVLFKAICNDGSTLALTCDPTGLCLKK